MLHLGWLLLSAALVTAQTCENYGTVNGSTCVCPTGYGGPTCSQLACGGDLFQGTHRALTPSSDSFGNLTASNCACEDGWKGVGCNVCQTSNACQAAYAAATKQSSSQAITGGNANQANDMTCNTGPRVWAGSQASCQIENPTLQAIYPLPASLNIIRTLDQSLTPIPNVTTFGASGTIYAQLIYGGVEQFYCAADSCQQTLHNNGSAADWTCQNLKCTCRPGTSFCGGVKVSDLTKTINALSGQLTVACGEVSRENNTATCQFQQSTLQSLFGPSGLALSGCSFGECVAQRVIDGNGSNPTEAENTTKSLSHGVIAGLAVVGGIVGFALAFLLYGCIGQRKARKAPIRESNGLQVGVDWSQISYSVPKQDRFFFTPSNRTSNDDTVILDRVSGKVHAGQMMAILGPSGAGKTTLVEILAGKSKYGKLEGKVAFTTRDGSAPAVAPRIGFVPQQDILPPTLTVYEALLFAARLRLPENVPDAEKQQLVTDLMEKLGISEKRNTRIGYTTGSKRRGISGGEMRRVSIGLELVSKPDILILDEPTSGLDSVSASRIAKVLRDIAHDPVNPIPVIASIHQPSSQLYQSFDSITLLSHGRALYSGPGQFSPSDYFARNASDVVPPYPQGYNVADYLLDIASDPHVSLFQHSGGSDEATAAKTSTEGSTDVGASKEFVNDQGPQITPTAGAPTKRSTYATTFLTQLEVLSGREWKILRRDKTLFLTHVCVSAVLGVFCGGLYYKTDESIAGFQSRVGCLFFLGALIAFSSLSALYNVVDTRPLFVRERSSSYYSPTAWLLSRFFFDVVPLRLVPTIIVSTITYWMAGLAPHAANFFKFLFILVLYTLAITLWNFLLGALFQNGGIAILLSALSALYQMTFAGFFVHLNSIPPVLRWLQWLCPLKYCLEALSVNEVGAGLLIKDNLQGVPVNISASYIMQLLFGFGVNNYYRDVLVLFAFIAGFGAGVIGIVWFRVRETR